MKNLNLFAILFSFTVIFTSCSTNEESLPENQPLNLLKSYTIKRDASGAYSLGFDLNGNTSVDNIKDAETNINKIYLSSSDIETKRQSTQDLVINGDHFKVGFIDTSSDNLPEITIYDDNISLAKQKRSSEKLKEYSISSNEDGTYNLDFSVREGVKVDFVYNEEIDSYEIHLENGETGDKTFSRTLEKESGKPLKFDFVNHITNVNARSSAKGPIVRRKPRAIII